MDAASLAGITTQVTTTISSVLPVGITIFAALIGVKLVPKLIRSFL